MSMLKEFKDFALRGNVVDMAVGVVIGAAFGKIVSSLVSDIIMPPLGYALGGIDFSNLFLPLSRVPVSTMAEAKEMGIPVIAYGPVPEQCHRLPHRSFRHFHRGKADQPLLPEGAGQGTEKMPLLQRSHCR